jgi:hypothetical protein
MVRDELLDTGDPDTPLEAAVTAHSGPVKADPLGKSGRFSQPQVPPASPLKSDLSQRAVDRFSDQTPELRRIGRH